MFKIYKITANDTNMVYLGLSKVDLYHRFYTQLNYSKKTGKLKALLIVKRFRLNKLKIIYKIVKQNSNLNIGKAFILIIQIFT